MPNYTYTARTQTGEAVSGLMQADNASAVARSLDERALFPVRVELQAEKSAAVAGAVRTGDLAVAYAQLADLLRAGVPLLRALETLAQATPRATLSVTLRAVRDDVSAGESLADAAAAHPRVFKPLHAAMIRAGERAGFLEDVLSNLAGFLDRQDELRNKVQGAMIYPAILVLLGATLIAGVLVGFVPRLEKFLNNAPQPMPTRVLFGVSHLLREDWPIAFGGAVVIVAAVMFALRSPAGRAAWSRWQLAVPVLGKLIRVVAISRFCRILGTMLQNGVPILQALEISKDAMGNERMAANVQDAADSVLAGETLAKPLRECGMFPVEIVEMISVAEESNQLDRVLVQIADNVDRRTTRQVDQAVRLIEPLILIVLTGIIGFVAAAIMYPIFMMSEQLG